MRIPIAYTLAWPERMETPSQRLSLSDIARLDFEEPDPQSFPALRLARQALEEGGRACAVLNAANEVAVEAFLGERIGFGDIARIVEMALAEAKPGAPGSIDEVVALDRETRERALARITEVCA